MLIEIKEKPRIEEPCKFNNVKSARKLVSDEEDRLLMSNWETWIRNSQEGGTFCYFIGDYVGKTSVGRLAYEAYEKKLVILYRIRSIIRLDEFEYWAKRVKNK